jgi:hypothetical protein
MTPEMKRKRDGTEINVVCIQISVHINGFVVVILGFKVVTVSRERVTFFPDMRVASCTHSNQHGHSSRDCLFAVGTTLSHGNKIANSDTVLIEG